MRGYEAIARSAAVKIAYRYESPCGVMRLQQEPGHRHPVQLRIPMRGYEMRSRMRQ